MKPFLPFLLSLVLIGPLQAQDRAFAMEPEPTALIGRISLLSPKLIAEIAPSDYFTLTAGFWLKTSFWDYDESERLLTKPFISPNFTFEPRFYFNLEDRQEKGKATRYYSGWYIGIPLNLEIPDFRYTMGGVVGFQCIMGKRWYWNISMGPGYTYSNNRFFWSGAGDLGLGIILNKM